MTSRIVAEREMMRAQSAVLNTMNPTSEQWDAWRDAVKAVLKEQTDHVEIN
jgi:hypothetical protein